MLGNYNESVISILNLFNICWVIIQLSVGVCSNDNNVVVEIIFKY